MYYDMNVDDIQKYNDAISAMNADPEISVFLRSISRMPLTLVPNQRSAHTQAGQCHENVRQRVLQNGGRPVYGWMIFNNDMQGAGTPSGVTTAIFHCNWESDDGRLINFTEPFYSPYQYFLPDPCRSWSFERREGYNNRTSFHRSFDASRAAFQPARNVTYYNSRTYYSREKQYEKFRMLKGTDELLDVLPDCWKRSVDGEMAISPLAFEHITLKYNISLPGR